MNNLERQRRMQLLERARQNMVAVAALFEGGLAILAWILGWLFAMPPADTLHFRWGDLGYGLLWTLPMIPPMWLMSRSRWRPFVRIQQVVNAIVVPLFSGCTLLQLALISILAGFGEEALFRGFVQNSIAQQGDVWLAIVTASVLFGFAHLITPAYAILATLIGLYLGWLMHFHDNLLVSITVHAAYDFLALVYLVRLNPHSRAVYQRNMQQMERMLMEADELVRQHEGQGDAEDGEPADDAAPNGQSSDGDSMSDEDPARHDATKDA